jgi:glutathione S-transferase
MKEAKMAGEFTLYGIPGSPYVRAALLTLREKGISYHFAAMTMGEQRSAAHLARNPFGRVPVLRHGDFVLYETQAIVRYLDRIVPHPSLVPADPVREARMNQVIGITDWYVFPDISAAIVFQRLIAPKIGRPVDEARIEAGLPKAHVAVEELSGLLGEQTFFAGDAMTLADLMLVPHLDYFAMTNEGREIMAPHAALNAWLGRMRARPSVNETTLERMLAAA